jgi:glycosyltransferase involved in cell wall biosynthesis
MKFVFVSYDYHADFESAEEWIKMTSGYAGILEQLGKNHEITAIQQTSCDVNKKHNGVQYLFVNHGATKRHFPLRLNNLVCGLDPDIVIVHGLHNPTQVIQLRLLLNRKVKIIAQNHAEKPAPGIRKLLQKIADRFIDAYFFASREMGLDWVTKGNLASPGKIHEVMEISSGFYPTERQLAKMKTGVSGQPAFLWVGRLNQNKDPLNVVKAFLRFVKVYPQARLYMIYHTDELLNEVKAALIEDHRDVITLVGKTPHHDLLYWYNSVDFIVAASYYEGSGTAICEAMSCGCVTVLTDIFSFRMMTDNGRLGFLYEPGNEEQLLSALIQTQQIDIEDQKAKTLTYYQTNLSFGAIAQRFEEIAMALIV